MEAYPDTILLQQVERRLQRAGEECVALLCLRDSQPAEPVGPRRAQVALEPDLVDRGRVGIGCWVWPV